MERDDKIMLDIRPLRFADHGLVADFFSRYPPRISEYTFTNLFVWRHARPVYFVEVAGALIFLIRTDGNDNAGEKFLIFGPPAGEVALPAVINALGDKCVGACRLAGAAVAQLQEQGLQVEADRDNADYVYRVRDLAALAGRRYAKKRNQVKRCLQSLHCAYEPITAANIAECLDLQESWCRVRACGREPGLCSEYIAIREIFKQYRRLGLLGGAVRVDNRLQAYAIGGQLSPGVAVCHFEKAMPGFPGLGQLINQWFAEYGLAAFMFVNREQDLGIPGLRQAKESYYPHHMVEKYNAFFGKSRRLSQPTKAPCSS